MNRIEIRLLSRGQRVRRRALNSPLRQGSAETLTYYVDFRPWGATEALPASTPVITILDEDDNDVTSTLNAGGGSIISNYEVQFDLTAVSAGKRYRVFVKATVDSDIAEAWTFLDGEK